MVHHEIHVPVMIVDEQSKSMLHASHTVVHMYHHHSLVDIQLNMHSGRHLFDKILLQDLHDECTEDVLVQQAC